LRASARSVVRGRTQNEVEACADDRQEHDQQDPGETLGLRSRSGRRAITSTRPTTQAIPIRTNKITARVVSRKSISAGSVGVDRDPGGVIVRPGLRRADIARRVVARLDMRDVTRDVHESAHRRADACALREEIGRAHRQCHLDPWPGLPRPIFTHTSRGLPLWRSAGVCHDPPQTLAADEREKRSGSARDASLARRSFPTPGAARRWPAPGSGWRACGPVAPPGRCRIARRAAAAAA
jgi:hypothetical protein